MKTFYVYYTNRYNVKEKIIVSRQDEQDAALVITRFLPTTVIDAVVEITQPQPEYANDYILKS